MISENRSTGYKNVGEYKIIKKIGKGVYGCVYKCKDNYGKIYAIKKFNDDNFFFNSGKREIEFLNNIKNLNFFAKIHDSFNINNNIYIIQDYLSIDMENRLKYHTFGLDYIRRISYDILNGLKELRSLSRPIVHGDLKPDNLILHNGITKIIDFSNAFYLDEYDKDSCGIIKRIYNYLFGNKHPYIQAKAYRAPEILFETNLVSKVDIWSTGCILFELFTGIVLFDYSDNKIRLESIFTAIGEDYSILEHVDNEVLNYYFEIDDDFEFYFRRSYKVSPNRTLESLLKENNNLNEDLNEFIDFLRSMLVINPIDRLDIEELLQHSFLIY